MAREVTVRACRAAGESTLHAQLETPQGQLDPDLDAIFEQQLTCDLWRAPPTTKDLPSPLFRVYAQSGEPPVAILRPVEGKDSAFAEEHARCLEHKDVLVITVSAVRHLLLVAVWTLDDDGTQSPTWWGFAVTPGLERLTASLFDTKCLALLLDLDETLVHSSDQATLNERMEACKEKQEEHRIKLAARTLLPCERPPLEAETACLEEEERMLTRDKQLLAEYIATDKVTVDGETHTPSWESDGTRPVVRLPAGHGGRAIFTRWDTSDAKTSMIMRFRPGWEEFMQHLAAGPGGKLRFLVHVCTAAAPRYAREVVRLLDPQGTTVTRTVCVDTLAGWEKNVVETLGVLDKKLARDEADGAHERQQKMFPGNTLFPLAVGLDDRIDVWTAWHQKQVVQLKHWLPYFNNSVRQPTADHELIVMWNGLLKIRLKVFESCAAVQTKVYSVAANGALKSLQQGRMEALLPPLVTVATVIENTRRPQPAPVTGTTRPAVSVGATMRPPPPRPGPASASQLGLAPNGPQPLGSAGLASKAVPNNAPAQSAPFKPFVPRPASVARGPAARDTTAHASGAGTPVTPVVQRPNAVSHGTAQRSIAAHGSGASAPATSSGLRPSTGVQEAYAHSNGAGGPRPTAPPSLLRPGAAATTGPQPQRSVMVGAPLAGPPTRPLHRPAATIQDLSMWSVDALTADEVDGTTVVHTAQDADGSSNGSEGMAGLDCREGSAGKRSHPDGEEDTTQDVAMEEDKHHVPLLDHLMGAEGEAEGACPSDASTRAGGWMAGVGSVLDTLPSDAREPAAKRQKKRGAAVCPVTELRDWCVSQGGTFAKEKQEVEDDKRVRRWHLSVELGGSRYEAYGESESRNPIDAQKAALPSLLGQLREANHNPPGPMDG